MVVGSALAGPDHIVLAERHQIHIRADRRRALVLGLARASGGGDLESAKAIGGGVEHADVVRLVRSEVDDGTDGYGTRVFGRARHPGADGGEFVCLGIENAHGVCATPRQQGKWPIALRLPFDSQTRSAKRSRTDPSRLSAGNLRIMCASCGR